MQSDGDAFVGLLVIELQADNGNIGSDAAPRVSLRR
jgi:hypothetical protein